MKAYVTRDSVCAGDDGDAPHARTLELPDDMTHENLVRRVVEAVRLPSIIGGNASWCVSSGIPLAVIAQQWDEPKLLHFIPPKYAELDVSGDTIKLHFSYFAQQDPNVVFDVLYRLHLRAR